MLVSTPSSGDGLFLAVATAPAIDFLLGLFRSTYFGLLIDGDCVRIVLAQHIGRDRELVVVLVPEEQ